MALKTFKWPPENAEGGPNMALISDLGTALSFNAITTLPAMDSYYRRRWVNLSGISGATTCPIPHLVWPGHISAAN